MTVGVITLSGFSLTTPDTTAPSVPVGLAGQYGDTTATLTWTASTDSGGGTVASYNVYKDGVLNQNVSVTSATITGLTNGTTYSLTVSAVDTAGNQSAQSTPVTVTPVTIYARDTFTRADTASTPGSTEIGGFAWTKNPSVDATSIWGIASNQLSKNSGAGTTPKELLIHDGHADGTVQATFVSSLVQSSGMVFRVASDNSSGFLVSIAVGDASTIRIKHRVGTTYTTLYSSPSGTITAGQSTVSVVLNGSSITLKVNGATITTITSTLDQTSDGFGLWNGTTSSSLYDNFEHNALTA